LSLLGVDVGTTGVKAAAFDHAGQMLHRGYREYAIAAPQPGWAEWDPEALWQATTQVITEAAGGAQAAGDPVTALAVCCLGLTFVPVDRQGKPTYPVIVAQDTRSAQELHWLKETFGQDRLSAITGLPLSPLYPLSKMLWLRQHLSEAFAATYKILLMHDYICLRLGLPPVTDYSLASSTMAMDRRTRCWSQELLTHAQLDEALLPQIAAAGTVLGPVGRKQAETLGLSPEVRLVVGGFDQMAAALGAGVALPAMAADAIGTVDCITATLPSAAPAEGLLQGGHPRHPHVVSGLDTTLAYCFSGGSVLRWYRDTFGAAEQLAAGRAGLDVYDLLTAQIPAGPSPVMLLPHFLGSGTPSCDPASKGALLGLTLSTTRGDIIKAILEGVSFEMRANLESLAQAGVPVQSVRAVGGGARCPAWLQLKADILGRPVSTVNVSEAGCLAMAMLAGTATGVYGSLAEAVQATVRITAEFQPRDQAVYEERYAIYRDIYPALWLLNRRL
jgi:xylulokinase